MPSSTAAELMSGIIQGSGIGPLLFLIFTNDLIKHLRKFGVRLKLFADDAKVYADIVDRPTCDMDRLQCALDSLGLPEHRRSPQMTGSGWG